MALTDDTREKLRFMLPKVGVPSDATDWMEDIEGADRLYVDEVKPVEDEAMAAREIFLAAGIPAVYFRAIHEGLEAYDYLEGDPPPGTRWYVGATPA